MPIQEIIIRADYYKSTINTKITLIEVGITLQDNLQTFECEELRKYDVLANELGQMHKAKVKVVPFTWDGKYHDTYAKASGIPGHMFNTQ
jgi:hypothetical protein